LAGVEVAVGTGVARRGGPAEDDGSATVVRDPGGGRTRRTFGRGWDAPAPGAGQAPATAWWRGPGLL